MGLRSQSSQTLGMSLEILFFLGLLVTNMAKLLISEAIIDCTMGISDVVVVMLITSCFSRREKKEADRRPFFFLARNQSLLCISV